MDGEKTKKEGHHEENVHAHRVACRHRHHRDSRRHAASRTGQGEAEGTSHQLHVQSDEYLLG